MDLGDITQLTLVATTALILGRLGWSLARLIDRRSSAQAVSAETTERLRALEDEHAMLRQDLAELQERQDFTERALVRERDQVNPPSPAVLSEPVVTPR
jgi:chromosome segregation ATPase